MLFSEETPSPFEKKFPFENKYSENNNSDNESVGDNFQSEKTDSESDSDTESIPESESSHDSDSVSSSFSRASSPEPSSHKENLNKPLIHFIDHTQKKPKYTPLVINKTNSDEIIDDTIASTNTQTTVTPTTSTSTPVVKPKKSIPLGLKAFHAFAKANRESVKQSNPDLTIGQIQSKLGSLWKALSNEEKNVWRSRI